MADEADAAGEYVQAEIDACIQRHAARKQPEPREDCVDCGDAIPDGRKALNVETCIDCQVERERNARRGKC